MNTAAILADPAVLRLEKIVAEKSCLTIIVSSVQRQAKCPLCNQYSRKKHSSYLRRVADLPWQGVPVLLRLAVHKFFCSNESCRRKVFTERLPSVVAAFARRATRLDQTFAAIAFALGGKAGAALTERLALTISRHTLLRRIRREAIRPPVAPRVVGVDDFAFRKRHTYGTIVVDLETREPIDLLPDRESKTVAEWFKAHPEIEVVARDRSQEYAEGISTGAPRAEQVADRWHLLKNAVDVLKEFLNQHSSDFHPARQAVINPNGERHEPNVQLGDWRTQARQLTREKRWNFTTKCNLLKKTATVKGKLLGNSASPKATLVACTLPRRFPNAPPFRNVGLRSINTPSICTKDGRKAVKMLQNYRAN